ncbi:MAG: FeoB-associated Cys-rich membrane protein [Defluviitaleaceae bacterium]|nr:FeoB-associated Cys-rich membrane protein [Defluviitaleaceae bacterium]
MGTLIVGLIVAFVMFLAARNIYQRRKSGSCGGCDGCNSCDGCNIENIENAAKPSTAGKI